MSALESIRRNKWFILGTLFLLINGYVAYRHLQGPTSDKTPLTATLALPDDGVLTKRSMTTLKWTFSGDMVSGFGIGKWFDEDPAAEAPVSIEPTVRGSFCWLWASTPVIEHPRQHCERTGRSVIGCHHIWCH